LNAGFTAASGNGDLIAIDPADPSTLYVAALNGVSKSTGWGVSWALQHWPVPQPVMVAVDPSNSQTIFSGRRRAGGRSDQLQK
jgi:hypothetical protein